MKFLELLIDLNFYKGQKISCEEKSKKTLKNELFNFLLLDIFFKYDAIF